MVSEVRPIFGRNKVKNVSTVKRKIEKFESTGCVVDVKHRTGTVFFTVLAIKMCISIAYKTELTRQLLP